MTYPEQNGNGRIVSLWKDITETKERAASWVFRGLIAIIMGMASVIGVLSWNALDRVAHTVDENGRQTSTKIEKLSNEIQQIANDGKDARRDIGVLSQTVTDHIHADDATDNRITSELADHEQRIRSLEHKPRL